MSLAFSSCDPPHLRFHLVLGLILPLFSLLIHTYAIFSHTWEGGNLRLLKFHSLDENVNASDVVFDDEELFVYADLSQSDRTAHDGENKDGRQKPIVLVPDVPSYITQTFGSSTGHPRIQGSDFSSASSSSDQDYIVFRNGTNSPWSFYPSLLASVSSGLWTTCISIAEEEYSRLQLELEYLGPRCFSHSNVNFDQMPFSPHRKSSEERTTSSTTPPETEATEAMTEVPQGKLFGQDRWRSRSTTLLTNKPLYLWERKNDNFQLNPMLEPYFIPKWQKLLTKTIACLITSFLVLWAALVLFFIGLMYRQSACLLVDSVLYLLASGSSSTGLMYYMIGKDERQDTLFKGLESFTGWSPYLTCFGGGICFLSSLEAAYLTKTAMEIWT